MARKALTATEVSVKGEDGGHVVLDRGEIRDLLKEGNLTGMYKYALHERSLPADIGEPVRVFEVGAQGGVLLEGRPKAESIISSSMPDRDGDIMWQDGMIITENYEKNPTVFPLHKHAIPVGFSEVLEQYKAMSWARWQWTVENAYTEGKAYYEMWEGHILNCVSVGFLINDWEPRDKDNFWGGWDIKEWELLEHSPVSLPSNREAMRTDGLKAMFRAYAEQVYAGASPILRKWFEEFEHKGAPLHVPVNIHLQGEKELRQAVRDGVKAALAEGGGAEVAMTCTAAVEGTTGGSECADEKKTFAEIRLAAAAGALPVAEAFELIGEIIEQNEGAMAEKELALATAEERIRELELEYIEFGADVVEALG